MTIFKACLKILLKNKVLLCIYFGIFVLMSMSMLSNKADNEELSFEKKTVKVSVINEDDSAYADSLIKYLKDNSNIVEIVESDEGISDALFYRYTEYVIKIPKGFGEAVSNNDRVSIDKYEVTGSYSGVFMDNMINEYIAKMKIYGPDVPDKVETTVNMKGREKNESNAVYAFNFTAYAIMAIIIFGVGALIAAFNQREIKMRNSISPVSEVKLGIYQILCSFLYTVVIWGLLVAVIAFALRNEGTSTATYYMILNMFVFCVSSLALGFFISTIIKSVNGRTIAANVIALGFSFIGGVMVPLNVLSSEVKIIGSFTPAYWFVSANEMLNEALEFGFGDIALVWRNMGIELLFAAAFLAAGLAAKRHMTA